jgi:hypothetical protein
VTEQEKLALLDQRARDLAAAANNLRRYEAAIEQAGGHVNHEIYGHLKHEIWEAEAALDALRGDLDRDRLVALGPDEIQQACRRAQEDAVAAIARAQGWRWEEDAQRWRTAQGTFYSRLGEPLASGVA